MVISKSSLNTPPCNVTVNGAGLRGMGGERKGGDEGKGKGGWDGWERQ